jgi:hypothetical protein
LMNLTVSDQGTTADLTSFSPGYGGGATFHGGGGKSLILVCCKDP